MKNKFKNYMKYQKISAKQFNNFMFNTFFIIVLSMFFIAISLIVGGFDTKEPLESIMHDELLVQLYLLLHVLMGVASFIFIMHSAYHLTHYLKFKKELKNNE